MLGRCHSEGAAGLLGPWNVSREKEAAFSLCCHFERVYVVHPKNLSFFALLEHAQKETRCKIYAIPSGDVLRSRS